MENSFIPIIPPMPIVPAKDPSTFSVIRKMRHDILGLWSEAAYENPIYRPKTLGGKILLVSETSAIRRVMTEAVEIYGRPISVKRLLRPMMSDGLILSEGWTWRRQRRMLSPVFTPISVDGLVPHFNAVASDLVRRLRGVQQANLAREMHETALDGVLSSLFSLPSTAKDYGFVDLIHRYLQGPGRPHPLDTVARSEGDFSFLFRGRRRFTVQRREAIAKLIAQRRASKDNVLRSDILEILLNAKDLDTGDSLSAREIEDQVATILFAGFETTSRHLFWTVFLLALDQVEQAAVRQEIAAFPPHLVTKSSDLQNWPRLRLVLYESLRLYPPGPNIARQARSSDILAGHRVNKGDHVWISPWVVHRHRKLWERPEEFRPSRFAGLNAPWSGGHFIPFGAGQRTCIAAGFAQVESQIIIATLLHNFHIQLAQEPTALPRAALTMGPDHEPDFLLHAAN